MATIHFVLQGKGGVGKTLVSSIIMQYLLFHNHTVVGVDTDQVNRTLTGYKGLHVSPLDIADKQNVNQIDPRKFDSLVDILTTSGDESFVIDNGASTFLPLCAYLKENEIFPILQENNQLFLHTLITGGQGMDDTVNGLISLLNNFQLPVVVWLNHFFGEIEHDGKGFCEFQVCKENRTKFAAIINIPQKTAATFGKDLVEMYCQRQTFAEAQAQTNTVFSVTRHRLTIWWREMCQTLDDTHLFDCSDEN